MQQAVMAQLERPGAEGGGVASSQGVLALAEVHQQTCVCAHMDVPCSAS